MPFTFFGFNNTTESFQSTTETGTSSYSEAEGNVVTQDVSGWLQKRLSPVKNASARWIELAETLEDFWLNLFSNNDLGQFSFLQLSKMRSAYTSDTSVLLKRLEEYGKRYEYGIASIDASDETKKTMAVALAMRRNEMLNKDTLLPTRLMTRRIFGDYSSDVVKPLYAFTDRPYASGQFFTKEEIEQELHAHRTAEDAAKIHDVDSDEYVNERSNELFVDGSWEVTDGSSHKHLGVNPKHSIFMTSRVMFLLDASREYNAAQITQLRSDFELIKPLHIVLEEIRYAFGFSPLVVTSSLTATPMNMSVTAVIPQHQLKIYCPPTTRKAWQITATAPEKLHKPPIECTVAITTN